MINVFGPVDLASWQAMTKLITNLKNYKSLNTDGKFDEVIRKETHLLNTLKTAFKEAA